MPVKAIDAVLSQPWAIQEEWLATIAAIAERESEYHNNLEALQAKLGRPLGNTMETTVRDGVAVIPFEGPMFRRANLMTAFSGATSYDMLAQDFTTALNDPSVKAIIGYFDTPGGAVNGASELSAMIKAARGQKPLVAYVGGTMASAGIWIGSAFDAIYAADTALVGSVGAQMGATVREPRAGEKNYRFVSSQSPLKNAEVGTEAGDKEAQRTVDQLAAVFIATLADNRGVSEQTILDNYGQGAVFVASDALKNGMIDAVSTFENVLSELSAEVKRMDYTSITAESLAEKRPDLFAAIGASAVTAAAVPNADAIRAEGAEAERKRIASIEALAMPGNDAVAAIIAAAKADATATEESTAMKVIGALRAAPTTPAAAPAATPAADAALAALAATESSFTPPAPANIGAEGSLADEMLASAKAAGVIS